MRASPQLYRSHPARTKVYFQGDAHGDPKQVKLDSSLDRSERNNSHALQQLVWILISLLLSLYLATSYLFWAKATSAWPIFPGFSP